MVRRGFDPVADSPHPLPHLLEDGEQLLPRIAARGLERGRLASLDLGIDASQPLLPQCGPLGGGTAFISAP